MKKSKLVSGLIGVIGSLVITSTAYAAGEEKLYQIKNLITVGYLSDSSTVKLELENLGDILFNTKCSKRRTGDLSRAYRAVVDSVIAADDSLMAEKVKALRYTITRSKMYTKCWDKMKSHSQTVADVGNLAFEYVELNP